MDFNSLLETAKKMGETASNQQKELENKNFSFSCQNNLITGKINGKYRSLNYISVRTLWTIKIC